MKSNKFQKEKEWVHLARNINGFIRWIIRVIFGVTVFGHLDGFGSGLLVHNSSKLGTFFFFFFSKFLPKKIIFR